VTKRRNRIGTISLLGAAAGFLLVNLQPWLPLDHVTIAGALTLKRLLAAFFDASLVGALADWFAVTALFRNPLGLKLAHTNIIARNKDAIADAVPRFLSGFVSEERLSAELARIDFAGKVETALGREETRQEIHEFLRSRVSSLAERPSDTKPDTARNLRAFVDEVLTVVSERVDAPTAFASVIQWARREGFDQRLIGAAAGGLSASLQNNRVRFSMIITPIVKKNAGWRGLFVGQSTIENLLLGLQEELDRMRQDPGHEVRRMIGESLETTAAKLEGKFADPSGVRERVRSTVLRVLKDPAIRANVVVFLLDLLRRIGTDFSRQESLLLDGLQRIEKAFVSRLGSSIEFRGRFNIGVASLIIDAITRSRLIDGASGYVARLLKATSEREFVGRIEDAIWNDLQYIRLNGAVVGALAGLILAIISAFFPM
jgi:uncharacterized membrane-anchored protein YjiN (DUF445 family)